MKNAKMSVILVLALGLAFWQAKVGRAEPMGTAFTYQGRLMDTNSPADGRHDFEFILYDAPSFGTRLAGTIEVNDLDVIDGYFTVELDFGSNVFYGDACWLQILVRPGHSNDHNDFVTLSPRQEVTPIPYALYARNAGNALTGSGTTNHIARFTRSSTLGDSVLYEENDYVGIGTTTPKSRLHIEQGLGAWGEGIRLSNEEHDWDIITGTGGERLWIAQDQDSTRGLVIHNGNVGIGTTSPYAKLHAVSDSNTDAGVMGIHYGYGTGVYGSCANGTGVVGLSISNYGVYGEGHYGVVAYSDFCGVLGSDGNGNSGTLGYSNCGVYGFSMYGYGVEGRNLNANRGHLGGSDYGVYGYSFDGYAGYFEGNVYVTANVSALSFTDRTPYPKDLATAYQAVMSMEHLPDGQYDDNNKELQLDHSKLSDFIRSDDGNRDLSATVSCHNEVLKELIRKQQELDKAQIHIEQLQKQNQLLETRLVKLEAIVARLNVSQEGVVK
jgi:hypothetical protein